MLSEITCEEMEKLMDFEKGPSSRIPIRAGQTCPAMALEPFDFVTPI